MKHANLCWEPLSFCSVTLKETYGILWIIYAYGTAVLSRKLGQLLDNTIKYYQIRVL